MFCLTIDITAAGFGETIHRNSLHHEPYYVLY